MISSNLRHCQACSQNKGLSEYQKRASCLWTSPSPLPEVERQTGDSQSWKARGNLCPRAGILYKTVSRLPVINQVFLGSRTVDIHQEGHSQRSAPQRRHMAHLRWCSCCTPWKPSDWDQGSDKTHHGPAGRACLPSTWQPELLGPRKGTKRRRN